MPKSCLCVFSGHSLWERKTHKQNSPGNPPKIPGQSCENFVYVFFFFMCFFRSLVLHNFGLLGACRPFRLVILAIQSRSGESWLPSWPSKQGLPSSTILVHPHSLCKGFPGRWCISHSLPTLRNAFWESGCFIGIWPHPRARSGCCARLPGSESFRIPIRPPTSSDLPSDFGWER